ncbi:MAG: sugar phosphate nucleotidyltransferase [Oscillospiraceae bacterium]|nr:sugar phosphate nucleotidyltransferase [Oscillospiraceae bacterium]
MKAVIMAGGEGTRLRPITLKMPKPLVPVLGESVINYIIRLLKKHKIFDAAITLMYLPEQIKNKYKNNFESVNLFYFEEETPLGTAGSVKNTKSFLLDKTKKSHDDFFIVISGDAICDTDITKAVEFYKNSQSDVTIILSKSENPLEFGGVVTDTGDSGAIEAFIEKPSWSQVFTDTINTGIYIISNKILDIIPDEKFYDFGKDLFPLLLKNKENFKMTGYMDENYWCDIGDLNAYYQCNLEAADDKIKIIKETNNYGTYCRYLSAGENCEIIESIIHDGVIIGNNVKIIKSIICRNTQIGDNVIINEGCIIGQDCIIKQNVIISGGVKIWNGKIINEGEKIMSNVIFSSIKYNLFDNDDGITGIFNDTLTPEYCVKIGNAAGIATSGINKTGRVGVMYSQSEKNNISRLIKDSLLCGIVASGAKSYDFGDGFASLAAFAAGYFKLDIILFADRTNDGKDIIKIFDYNTLSPSRPFERKFESALFREDFKPPIAEELNETEIFRSLKFLYFNEIIKNAGNLKGFKAAIKLDNVNKTGAAAYILKKALTELSAEVYDLNINENINNNIPENAVIFEIGDDGFSLRAYYNNINNTEPVDFWHIEAILIQEAVKNGETEIVMPYLAPDTLQIIAEKEGADVLRYISCPFDENDFDLKTKSKIISQFYMKDACFAAVKLCSVLYNSNKTLKEHINALPKFISKNIDIEVDNDKKTSVMRNLNEQLEQLENLYNKENKKDYRSKEGMKLNFLNGYVNIVPKKSNGFKLIAEALSTEAADEMLNAADNRIKSILYNLKQ